MTRTRRTEWTPQTWLEPVEAACGLAVSHVTTEDETTEDATTEALLRALDRGLAAGSDNELVTLSREVASHLARARDTTTAAFERLAPGFAFDGCKTLRTLPRATMRRGDSVRSMASASTRIVSSLTNGSAVPFLPRRSRPLPPIL